MTTFLLTIDYLRGVSTFTLLAQICTLAMLIIFNVAMHFTWKGTSGVKRVLLTVSIMVINSALIFILLASFGV